MWAIRNVHSLVAYQTTEPVLRSGEEAQPYFSASLVQELVEALEKDAQHLHDLSRHPLHEQTWFARCEHWDCVARRKRIDDFKAQSSLKGNTNG